MAPNPINSKGLVAPMAPNLFFIGFGRIHGPKSDKLIGFGDEEDEDVDDDEEDDEDEDDDEDEASPISQGTTRVTKTGPLCSYIE